MLLKLRDRGQFEIKNENSILYSFSAYKNFTHPYQKKKKKDIAQEMFDNKDSS